MSGREDNISEFLTRRRELLASGAAVSASMVAGCGDLLPGELFGETGLSDDQLVVTQQVAPIEWDPVVIGDAYSLQVVQTVFDGLYEYEPGTLEPQPKLATGEPEIERDGERFIVELEEGPEFHNGDPVTAEDVVHTFTAPVEEETDNLPDVDMIEDAVEIDERTVQFDLEAPYSPFETVTLARLVVNKDVRESDRDAYNEEDPVGSGPYELVDAEIGNYAEVTQREEYWDDMPDVPSIYFEVREDDSARVTRIESEETHMIEGIPPANWPDFREDDSISIAEVESTGVMYMAFNCNEGPTTDPDVREAIAHVHDVSTFVEEDIGEAAVEAFQPVPPVLVDEWDFPADEWEDKRREFDQDYAKDLLDDSPAIEEDYNLTVIVPPDDVRERWGETVVSRLDEIGYEANVQRLEWGQFTDRYTTGDEDDFNIYTLGWTGGADPDVYLYDLFHESQEGVNQGHYYEGSDSFHDDIIAARQETDQDERRELYVDIIDEILDEVVWIPGWTDNNAVAYLDDLVNAVEPDTNTSYNPRLDHHGLNMSEH